MQFTNSYVSWKRQFICGIYPIIIQFNFFFSMLKHFAFILFSFCLFQVSHAQTRIYLTGTLQGASELALEWNYAEDGTPIGYLTKFSQPGIELAIEKRLSGQLYVYSGMAFNQYQTVYQEPGIAGSSEIKQALVSFPLLLRINSRNRNSFYTDIGLVPYYVMAASLKESYAYPNSGNVTQDEGNVAPFLPRVGINFRYGLTFALNRLVFGGHVNLNLTNRGTGDLIRNWDLTGSESLFLNSEGSVFKFVYGIHVGYRLK